MNLHFSLLIIYIYVCCAMATNIWKSLIIIIIIISIHATVYDHWFFSTILSSFLKDAFHFVGFGREIAWNKLRQKLKPILALFSLKLCKWWKSTIYFSKSNLRNQNYLIRNERITVPVRKYIAFVSLLIVITAEDNILPGGEKRNLC